MADLEFRLDVIETEDTWTIVCECPQGRQVVNVPTPFSADELQSQLRAVEMSLVRSTSPLVTRRAARPEQVFGRKLTRILLSEEIRVLYALCREKAREQGVRMRVLLNPVGRNVCRIPWEFITDPDADDEHLALRVAIARTPHLMEPTAPLRIVPPLRVLGVMSRPRDLAQLEADHERSSISSALGHLTSDLLHVEWLDSDRWQVLRSRLSAEPWHILHFIGHGGFDEDLQSGYLELTDEEGNALPVQASDVAGFIRDNPQLKLVVLNACESAAAGDDGIFSSTAAKLVRAGVPAVVAMQFEITDPAALAFSYSFYEAIARGTPVDRAVTHAREEVKITTRSLEWATPVLFLASSETHVFEVPEPEARIPAPIREPQEPPPYSPPPSPAAAAPDPNQASDWTGQVRTRLTTFMDKLAELQAPARRSASLQPVSEAPATTAGPAVPPAASPHEGAARPALRRLTQSPAYGDCTHARLGPNDLVALACPTGLRAISLARRREVARCSLPQAGPPVKVAWSPWPRNAATVDLHGTVVIWDLGSEAPLQVLRPQGQGRATHLEFSHSGRWLAVAGSDLTVRVFNTSGAAVRSFPVAPLTGDDRQWSPPPRAISALAFTPDDRGLLVAADDGTVRRYDVHGRLTRSWRHTHPVAGLAATDTELATTCDDGRIRLWSWDGGLAQRLDHYPAEHVAISSADRMLAVIADAVCTAWSGSGDCLGSASLAGRGVGLGISASLGLVSVTASGVIESWTPSEGTEGR